MSRILAGLSVVVLGLVGCGGGSGDGSGFADAGDPGSPVADSGQSSKDGKPDAPKPLGTVSVSSITVSPDSSTLSILNGAVTTKAFTATAHYSNGSTQVLDAGMGVAWAVDQLPVGTVASSGLFTPTGTQGGVVQVAATYGGLTGKAALTVSLHVTSNPAGLTPAEETLLTGATTADASVVWAYPYDGTVFPRDLAAPSLMWNGGAAGDVYYVKVASATFEYETFAAVPPPAAFALDATAWTELTNSTSGAATLTVKRLTGGTTATVVHSAGWTIAPAALRGAVYYWANNLGHVERIKPGAAMPDDFANQAPLNDPTQYPKQSSCLMTCHTVSADGSTLVSGGGTFGGSYDLLTDQPMNSLGYVWGWVNPADGTSEDDWQNTQWMSPAISPDGKYLAVNGVAEQLAVNSGGPGGFEGLYKTADGTQLPNTGLESLSLLMPAWSPDGKLISFVDGSFASAAASWDIGATGGPLQVLSIDTAASPMVTNVHDLIQPGSDPTKSFIAWPSVSPDSRWVIYQRGETLDTRFGSSGVAYTDNQADLYLADAENPGVEVRLGKLDGDGYPFAAGTRDVSLNYEPTFAPVASGGYFWVVFTSRRTYGNILTGDQSVVKQLWVAAIDQTNSGTKTSPNDPSHAPFLLPGQDNTSLNMRGYFALPPCQGNGTSCGSGTDCCNGYCNASGDAGAMVCASSAGGCSLGGDHCATTADCCGASTGAMCINQVCSEATPK